MSILTKDYHYKFNGRRYRPVAPQADTDELSKDQDRLILQHNKADGPAVIIADREILTSGLVIGLFY